MSAETTVPYEDEDRLEELLEELRFLQEKAAAGKAELARHDLFEFVKQAWTLVEPEKPFVENWHIIKLCRVLEAVSRGEISRLIINVPPGTMKSLLVSVFWPAWEWIKNPRLRYMTASYGAHLSHRDSKRFSDIISSPWYRKHFRGVVLKNEAPGNLTTDGKGWRIATSVGGVGTGQHPDRVIIDDPHTAEQARSDVERARALAWFDGTISTRGVVRNVVVVLIMQRLHEGDLTGHLLSKWEKGTYTHIMWPMRFEKERADPLDPRTEEGELMWPALFTAPIVRQMEIDLQELSSGQMQQNFKRIWFKLIEELPKVEGKPLRGTLCRGWDTAASEGEGDWTVGVKTLRGEDGNYYIVNVVRGQWSPANVDKVMLQTAKSDGRWCRQREEKEPGSSGKAVIEARRRLLAGFDYDGVQVDQDKVTRSRPFRSACEAGNVYILLGEWNQDFFLEYEKFPNGNHDDQVDGGSCSFNELHNGPRPVVARQIGWG
jgi:predicted phage terminase large subunit-like protein